MLIKQARPLQAAAMAVIVGIALAGMACSKQLESKPANHSKVKDVTNNPAFHKQLLDVAAEYKNYGKVDDWARWAPTLCVAPPPQPRLSASKDLGTHGRKVYFLFAKDRDQYFKNEPPKPGQVVVKESWHPAAESDGKPSPSDTQSDLFIMLKLDPQSRDTDNGWVYGTVTPDGKTVTSAGRIQSCMECHSSAPNDRLFGLAK